MLKEATIRVNKILYEDFIHRDTELQKNIGNQYKNLIYEKIIFLYCDPNDLFPTFRL